jgi:hypothetical protein
MPGHDAGILGRLVPVVSVSLGPERRATPSGTTCAIVKRTHTVNFMLQDVSSATGRVLRALAREPSRIGITVRGAYRVARQIIGSPTQVRYLARWVPTVERSTMDLGLPWLPFEIIDRLDQFLSPSSRVFEYGGGGSTLWFAQRAGEVVTAEHDPDWLEVLRARTAELSNVTILAGSPANEYADYVPAIDAYPDGYFDVVVIDGRERVRTFERSVPKVKPGGMLMLDDSERRRYRPVFDIASTLNHETVRGLAPCKSKVAQTTVWTAPVL